LLSWLRLATTSSARFEAASPYLFVRKIPYVIDRQRAEWILFAPTAAVFAIALITRIHTFPHSREDRRYQAAEIS
jgi:hypothetical protein